MDDAIFDADGTLGPSPTDPEEEQASSAASPLLYSEVLTHHKALSTSLRPTPSPAKPIASDYDADLIRSVFGGDSPLSTPPPSRAPSPKRNSQQRRNQKRSREKRTLARQEAKEAGTSTLQTQERISRARVAPAPAKTLSYSAKSIPTTSKGYVAKVEKAGGVYTLPQLLAQGFELVKWDGR